MKGTAWVWSLIALVVVSAASYGVFVATRPVEMPAGFLYGNGHVEGTEVRVASEVTGRVVEHRLTEGESVSAGETVVVIDPQASRDRLRAVEGELDALRESLATLDSQTELWAHHLETARRQLARIEELVGRDLASERDVDEAENAVREAHEQLEGLEAQRESVEARVRSSEARVRLAETTLERTEVPAPGDGTVLVRAVEVGEVVQAGQPLGLVVDLDRLELKVYVPEADLGKVRLGSSARVRVNAFPDRYFEARVARVDDYAQFTPRDIHVPSERTRMVFGVTLALDNAEGRLKPGMPADAWIRWDETKEWPAALPVPAR